MESMAIGLPSLRNRGSSVRHGSFCSFHGPHGGKQVHGSAWSALRSSVQVNCQRIAETASAEGNRQRWLGILYDEVCPRASCAFVACISLCKECRRNWAERAFAGEKPDIAREALSINQERLFLAKSVYDSKVKVSCIHLHGSISQLA